MTTTPSESAPAPGWAERLIGGPQVFLRYPVLEDFAAFRRLREASAEHLAPWDPAWPPGRDPATREGFEGLVAWTGHDRHFKLLACRREEGAILGMVNLNGIVRGMLQNASLGYWTGAPYLRQGYTGAALALAITLAFEDLGLHRVSADIRPENKASIALVRRAGFRLEGYSPRMVKIAGTWADHERYALLVDEWSGPPTGVDRPTIAS